MCLTLSKTGYNESILIQLVVINRNPSSEVGQVFPLLSIITDKSSLKEYFLVSITY